MLHSHFCVGDSPLRKGKRNPTGDVVARVTPLSSGFHQHFCIFTCARWSMNIVALLKQVGTKCPGLQVGFDWDTGSSQSPQGGDNNYGNLSDIKVLRWKLYNFSWCNYLTLCLSHRDSWRITV